MSRSHPAGNASFSLISPGLRRFGLLFLSLCCLVSPARAQFREHAMPTASRAGDLQIGGAFVAGTSAYNFNRIRIFGGGAYSTFDVRPHWGFEANFRRATSSADSTVSEETFEIGPRILLTRGRLAPYAKAMYGRGVYNFSNNVANIAYNMYTFGGGADFAITQSLNLRTDYELQSWAGFPLGTLHPSVGSIGLAFHFHQ